MFKSALNFTLVGAVVSSAIVLLALVACVSPPRTNYSQPQEIATTETYLHEKAGFKFPVDVGGFQRRSVTRFDQEGLDVGAGYGDTAKKRPIEISAYVYPGGHVYSVGSPADVVAAAQQGVCDQAYKQSKGDILKAHQNAVVVNEKSAKIKIAKKSLTQYQVHFRYEGQKTGSSLVMYCPFKVEWNLKLRATYSDSFEGRKELASWGDALLKANGVK